MISLFVYAVLSAFFKDVAVSALSVSVSPKVIGLNGSNAEFRIGYALESDENFTLIELEKEGGIIVFMAPYVVQMQRIEADGGCVGSYASRCSTDYSNGKTNFIITLSQVTPDDEGQYTVQVQANNVIHKTAVSQLVVEYPPGTPSISGAPTQPVVGGAGPTVIQCEANLGKPQASMVWSRRIGNAAYTNITENVTMTTDSNNDGTTTGISSLTVNWNKAVGLQFRCLVFNRHATLSAETAALETDTIKPTENGGGRGTFKPTGNGEDTVKPTENGKGGGTFKPTENGEGGVSAGRDDIPNKLVLVAAFVVMAMISTIF